MPVRFLVTAVPALLKARAKLWMRGCDSWEQGAILAPVVTVQGCTEAVAEQQQLSRGRRAVLPLDQRVTGDAQGFANPGMRLAQFVAPGDQPGCLALSHA